MKLSGRILFWLSWPGLWLMLKDTRRTRVIISYKDKILVVQGWLSSGHWLLPGGGLHRGEEAVQCAIRETFEETGINLDEKQLTYQGEQQVTEFGIRYTAVIFRTEFTSEPALRPQKMEISEIGWLPKNRLDNLSPATRQIIGS